MYNLHHRPGALVAAIEQAARFSLTSNGQQYLILSNQKAIIVKLITVLTLKRMYIAMG